MRRQPTAISPHPCGYRHSFSPSPESLRSLADLRGQASRRALDAEVTIEEFQGEVAIGTEDGLLHQMTVTMSGHEQQNPEATFRLSFTISLWDTKPWGLRSSTGQTGERDREGRGRLALTSTNPTPGAVLLFTTDQHPLARIHRPACSTTREATTSAANGTPPVRGNLAGMVRGGPLWGWEGA